MAEISVTAEPRHQRGSAPSRRLRASGKIPGIVYGHGAEPIAVAVGVRELRAALTTEAGTNALIDLAVGPTRHLVVARELQRHPVKGTVTHVDFQVVRRDEVISAEAPVALVGEAVEVAHSDGRVDQQTFALTVKALPSDIPTVIEVDISGLRVGDSIKVGDIALPAGVAADTDPETVVVVAQAARKGADAAGVTPGGAGEEAASVGGEAQEASPAEQPKDPQASGEALH